MFLSFSKLENDNPHDEYSHASTISYQRYSMNKQQYVQNIKEELWNVLQQQKISKLITKERNIINSYEIMFSS
jgi:hypothetical protein